VLVIPGDNHVVFNDQDTLHGSSFRPRASQREPGFSTTGEPMTASLRCNSAPLIKYEGPSER
jgi:hypothetical protein